MSAQLTEDDLRQIEQANRSGLQPALFVHGLWLLPGSWEPWAERFAQQGFAPILGSWPDDPESVTEAKASPNATAGTGIAQVVRHLSDLVQRLSHKPVIVGHSFGGLLTEILAGRGLASASVAIAPAGFRGVLPLPLSALRSASPVLRNPANRGRAVPLTFDQFRYAFANAVSEAEAHALYERFAVPAPGKPLFEAALANLNPWTDDKVDTHNPDRGPLLLIAGENDHTVPPAVVRAAYDRQRQNPGTTEYLEMPGRGHALTIDNGWREVADASLAFLKRFTSGLQPWTVVDEASLESFPASDAPAY